MTHSTTATVGWDIGGVNTKAALVELDPGGARRLGLEPIPLGERLGDGARTAPAVAVAWLLAESLVKT
jgi:uncharacterized hydantoinase/oxoprolinase family protein